MSEELHPSRVFEVFARQTYDEPLHHVGLVRAPDQELAQVYARTIYDEWSWVEMIIVPREAIVQVIKP